MKLSRKIKEIAHKNINQNLLAYILSAKFQKEYMKAILAFAIVVILYSCSEPRELQAEMVSAELVKIDTVFRYANDPKQILTWRDDNHIDYITYAPLTNSFLVGSRMIVLVKR